MKLSDLFHIRYGQKEVSNVNKLEKGRTLLISSRDTYNGCYGFYDIDPKFKQPVIIVPRTGSVGCASVQLIECSSTDYTISLEPKKKLPTEYLFYVASVIRNTKWRFNYARNMTPKRLGKIELFSDTEFKPELSYGEISQELYPKRNIHYDAVTKNPKLKSYTITELFDLERGQFHSIEKLEKGNYITISRVSTDNGVIGFYAKPSRAKVYEKYLITVSSVTGDAFIQYINFIATDNVVICKPKKPYKITTLIYVQAFLNKTKWRYSYGRQCYKRIFQKTIVFLPITNKNEIDEEYIEKIVKNQPYWKEFEKRLLN